MNSIPERHKGGRAFFQPSGSAIASEADYFSCLESLRPLFEVNDFQESTPGFYISCIGNTLRLNCYSIDVEKTRKAIEDFVRNPNRKISLLRFEGLDQSSNPDLETEPGPRKLKVLQLRNCLNASTRVVLDLLKQLGIKETRELFSTYASDFLPLGESLRKFFEPKFNKNSDFYRSLTDYEANQFWQALLFYQPEICALGIHFSYNMLLLDQGQVDQHLPVTTI